MASTNPSAANSAANSAVIPPCPGGGVSPVRSPPILPIVLQCEVDDSRSSTLARTNSATTCTPIPPGMVGHTRYIETHDGDIEFIAILPAATTQSIATHPLSDYRVRLPGDRLALYTGPAARSRPTNRLGPGLPATGHR